MIALALFAWRDTKAEAEPDPGHISVSGDAEVRVVPDEGLLTLGVETWDEDLDGLEGENEGYSLMLQLKYNLFNGGGDSAKSKQAAFLVNESKARQDLQQRVAIEELNTAWTTYKAVRNQLIYLKQHVDASVQTQEAYDKQFNLGRRTLLDLLDARNELFQANRAYFSAQHDSMYQQYRILAAMGMLAKQFGDN